MVMFGPSTGRTSYDVGNWQWFLFVEQWRPSIGRTFPVYAVGNWQWFLILNSVVRQLEGIFQFMALATVVCGRRPPFSCGHGVLCIP